MTPRGKTVVGVFLVVIGLIVVALVLPRDPSPIAEVAEEQAAQAVADKSGEETEIMESEEKSLDEITTAMLDTSMGAVTIEFMRSDAPETVENFIRLANDGFYDGVKFHRVIDGFMIQTGDPLSKEDDKVDFWGTGGPGYTFPDEIHENNQNAAGTLAMANAGPDTNGSQFFINVADNNFLDEKHTVFARVTGGMDVVASISTVETTGAPKDRPLKDVVIKGITLE